MSQNQKSCFRSLYYRVLILVLWFSHTTTATEVDLDTTVEGGDTRSCGSLLAASSSSDIANGATSADSDQYRSRLRKCLKSAFAAFPRKTREYSLFARCGYCSGGLYDWMTCVSWRGLDTPTRLGAVDEDAAQIGREPGPEEDPDAADAGLSPPGANWAHAFSETERKKLLVAGGTAFGGTNDAQLARGLIRFLYPNADWGLEDKAMAGCLRLCCGGAWERSFEVVVSEAPSSLPGASSLDPWKLMHPLTSAAPAAAEESVFRFSGPGPDSHPCRLDSAGRGICVHENLCLRLGADESSSPPHLFILEQSSPPRPPALAPARPLFGYPRFSYGTTTSIDLWSRLFSFDFPPGFTWPSLTDESLVEQSSGGAATTWLSTVYGVSLLRDTDTTTPYTSVLSGDRVAGAGETKQPLLVLGFPDFGVTLWHFVQYTFGIVGALVQRGSISRYSSLLISDPAGWLVGATAVSNWCRRVFEILVGETLGSESGISQKRIWYFSRVGAELAAARAAPRQEDLLRRKNEEQVLLEQGEQTTQQAKDRLLDVFLDAATIGARSNLNSRAERSADDRSPQCFPKAVFVGWSPYGASGGRELGRFREHVLRLYPQIRFRKKHVLFLSRNAGKHLRTNIGRGLLNEPELLAEMRKWVATGTTEDGTVRRKFISAFDTWSGGQ